MLSDALLAPPSPQHLFGTDELGRDVVSEVIYGSRVSIVVGLAAAAAATSFGVLVGIIAGYYSGAVDAVLMRISEFFQVLPTFIVAALIVAMLGPGAGRIVMVIALLAWPLTARLTRGEVVRIKPADFVEAARSIGMSDASIMRTQILPNALPPVVAAGTLITGRRSCSRPASGFSGWVTPPSLVGARS
jgi:peptide/nickel transport system permease protein